MTDNLYLKRLFKSYYEENKLKLPSVNLFEHREFGFIPWEKAIMIRHMGFANTENLSKYLIDTVPRHVYSSGTLYLQPDNPEMNKKQYQGCDLIIDIDVDHFYTPCKEDHDTWECKECGKTGKGMNKKCPKCKSLKLKSLAWICEDCLEVAKNEIIKLIYDFLIPDFGIKTEDMNVAFSGHRGYHLKVENRKIRTLSSEARREIVDYMTGENMSLEILGLRQVGTKILGPVKGNIGWSDKIIKKIEKILLNYSTNEIVGLLERFGLNKNTVLSFMNSKDEFLKVLSNKNMNLWSIEGFGIKTWKTFLQGIVGEIGAEIDEPVTIDIHRLIRYPGSLHGKSGFKVQELSIKELDDYNPLDETNKELDPIVFYGDITQKLKVNVPYIPVTKIKGKSFGPYKQGKIIEVPNHVAVFLLCKEVVSSQ